MGKASKREANPVFIYFFSSSKNIQSVFRTTCLKTYIFVSFNVIPETTLISEFYGETQICGGKNRNFDLNIGDYA